MRRIFEWLLVLLTLAALVVATAAAAILFGEHDFAQRIYPHISVRGVPVGGMTRDAARQAIERRDGSGLMQSCGGCAPESEAHGLSQGTATRSVSAPQPPSHLTCVSISSP
ncbi:MAG: hypothetical protein WCJ55_16220 [Chloroflexales bacterium]